MELDPTPDETWKQLIAALNTEYYSLGSENRRLHGLCEELRKNYCHEPAGDQLDRPKQDLFIACMDSAHPAMPTIRVNDEDGWQTTEEWPSILGKDIEENDDAHQSTGESSAAAARAAPAVSVNDEHKSEHSDALDRERQDASATDLHYSEMSDGIPRRSSTLERVVNGAKAKMDKILKELKGESKPSRPLRLSSFGSDIKESASPWRKAILRCVTSVYFEGFFNLCIVANAVTIGFEAQDSLTHFLDAPMFFSLAELVFLLVFAFELASRFLAVGAAEALKNPWVRFDSFCVSCGSMDVLFRFIWAGAGDVLSKVTVMRIFRLARLARAVRFFVQFRTLWLLLVGMRASITTVVWTLVLIVSISYIFAVLGMETIPPKLTSVETPVSGFDEVATQNFGGITPAMITLLQTLTLDSVASIYRPLIENSGGAFQLYIVCYFLSYIMFVSITAMNLVTAIMVEGSMQQASEDKESMIRWEEQKRKAVLPKLREMFMLMDADGSGEVTLEELDDAPEELLQKLKSMTNTADLGEFFYLVDDDGSGSVNIDEFLDAVISCSSAEAVQSLKISRLMKQCDKIKYRCEQITNASSGQEKSISSKESDVTT